MWVCVWLCVAPQLAQAQSDEEAQREAQMFGQPDPSSDDPPPESTDKPEAEDEDDEDASQAPTPEAPSEDAPIAPQTSTSSREEAMFGEEPVPQAGPTARPQEVVLEDPLEAMDEALEEAEDRLALGGFLFMQGNYSINESDDSEDWTLRAPQLFDLFLDARPNPRLRTYARARLLYDFTINEPTQTLLGEPEMPDGQDLRALGRTPSKTTVQLDQLWVKFDINRAVYVTIGRQRIRWGAGRFWNPTDFLNASQIDPLALFDARLGVDLIKLHYPVESLGWNFYAFGILGDATNLGDVGGALRGEFVFGTNEVSLSFSARRQTFQGPNALPPIYEPDQQWPNTTVPLRFGIDYSGALGPLDLRAEGALTRGLGQPFYRGNLRLEDLGDLALPRDLSREDEWLAQAVVGAEVAIKYNDEDSLFLGAEYFYNQWGYEDPDLYLWLLLQGGFRPLYLGRHYAGVGAILPSPGSWNDSTFSLSALGNLSDRSFLSRLDYSVRVLTDLSVNVFATKYLGRQGEFKFRVQVPSLGTTPEVNLPAPSWDLGAGLRMSF